MTIFWPRFTVNRFVVNNHRTRSTTTVSHTHTFMLYSMVYGKLNYIKALYYLMDGLTNSLSNYKMCKFSSDTGHCFNMIYLELNAVTILFINKIFNNISLKDKIFKKINIFYSMEMIFWFTKKCISAKSMKTSKIALTHYWKVFP